MWVEKISNSPGGKGIKFLIISGTHGNESHAVKAVYETFKSLNKQKLKGVEFIKWMLNLNEYGLVFEERENNYSEKETDDCNRLFPKTFHTVEEIREVLEHQDADIVIDVHNSPNCLPCVLLDYDKYLNRNLTLIEGSSLLPLVRHTNIGTIKKKFNSFYSKSYTVELPGMGITGDYKTSAHYLEELIKTIIANYNEPIKEWNVSLPIELYTKIEQGLISYMRENPVGEYEKDDIIALVEDIEIGEIEKIKAPYKGYVFDIPETVYVSNINPIIMYGSLPC